MICIFAHIMCTCVYIYAHLCTYIHTCMIDICANIHIMYIYAYIYIYIYMHTYLLHGPKLHLTSLCAHICLKPLNIQSNLDRNITCTHVVLKRSLSYKHYI